MADYTETKTGKKYAHLSDCKIKINEKWIDGVVYLRDGGMFVRTKDDFAINFERIKK